MLIIDNTTVVVYSYDELKSALEGTYTYVYLGNNITMTNGIKINRLTKELIINGTYEGITYILEDKKSLSASDTITISSNITTKITVCNVKFIGYNYYGIIYIPDSKINDTGYQALFTGKGLPSGWTFKKLSEKPAK